MTAIRPSARAAAAASPVKGCYDVLLTGEHVRTVLGYYLFRRPLAHLREWSGL